MSKYQTLVAILHLPRSEPYPALVSGKPGPHGPLVQLPKRQMMGPTNAKHQETDIALILHNSESPSQPIVGKHFGTAGGAESGFSGGKEPADEGF